MDWLDLGQLLVALLVANAIVMISPDVTYKAMVLGLLIYFYWKMM